MSKLNYKDRLFIGQIIPNNKVLKYRLVSQAGNHLCYNFIECIKPGKVYSLIPTYFKKKVHFKYEFPVEVIQERKFLHKGAGRVLNSIIENLKLFYKVSREKQQIIWLYNITKHFLLFVLLLKIFTNKKLFILVADFTPPSGKISLNNLILFLIKKSDGVLALSANAKGLLNTNIEIMEGLLKKKDIQYNTKNSINKKVLFSGLLSNTIGIELALNLFSKKKDWQLIITGKGMMEEKVKEFSFKYPNIKYLGYLPYDEYQAILDQCDICLSLRNPENRENFYNFPSKVMEYLSKSKIVISTMKYQGFENMIYFLNYFDENCLCEKLDEIIEMPTNEITLMRKNIYKKLQTDFTFQSCFNKVKIIENKKMPQRHK